MIMHLLALEASHNHPSFSFTTQSSFDIKLANSKFEVFEQKTIWSDFVLKTIYCSYYIHKQNKNAVDQY